MTEADIIFWILIAVSPFIGSFIGVVVRRYPKWEGVIAGRSRCESCGHDLGPSELVPFASWIALRGRCRHCGAPIAPFHLYIEAAAIAVVWWASLVVSGWLLAATCFFGWMLLTLALIDWEHFRLPDAITLPLLVLGMGVSHRIDPGSMLDRMIAIAGGFFAFWLLGTLYRAARGRDGLGFGDAKLVAALGAWLSWVGLPTAVLYAAAMGLAAVLAASLRGRPVNATTRIPFGTFLAAGAWLVWLYGPLVAA